MAKKNRKNALFSSCDENNEQIENVSDDTSAVVTTENYEMLLQKNSELEDRLANLIAENDRLRRVDQTESNNDDLNQQLQNLQHENDEYLLKISELSFENAKLSTEIQELKRQLNSTKTIHRSNNMSKPTMGNRTSSHPMVNKRISNNGYEDWN